MDTRKTQHTYKYHEKHFIFSTPLSSKQWEIEVFWESLHEYITRFGRFAKGIIVLLSVYRHRYDIFTNICVACKYSSLHKVIICNDDRLWNSKNINYCCKYLEKMYFKI